MATSTPITKKNSVPYSQSRLDEEVSIAWPIRVHQGSTIFPSGAIFLNLSSWARFSPSLHCIDWSRLRSCDSSLTIWSFFPDFFYTYFQLLKARPSRKQGKQATLTTLPSPSSKQTAQIQKFSKQRKRKAIKIGIINKNMNSTLPTHTCKEAENWTRDETNISIRCSSTPRLKTELLISKYANWMCCFKQGSSRCCPR